MYFGARPVTIETARLLRSRTTHSENLLWDKLNRKKICGVRFRRQHPIMFFIVDFYCHEAKLVVEVDGEIHEKKTVYDDGRSAEMEKFGILVFRVKNDEVENNIKEVVCKIENIVNERLKSPAWGI